MQVLKGKQELYKGKYMKGEKNWIIFIILDGRSNILWLEGTFQCHFHELE